MKKAVCDHLSVGVAITDDADRWLMFERVPPLVGVAPAACHVDDHGSTEKAARHLVTGQLRLTVTGLELFAGGWRSYRCHRRVGAGHRAGHEWTVYRAIVTGDLAPGPHETRDARWLDVDRLQELTDRTADHARGTLTAEAFAAAPGIEPMWVWWLHVLGAVNATHREMVLIGALAERSPTTIA
ncbi:NUDIX domain-containing protein [Microtetraspora glauca]|uniref:NUDIX domain-containing protein n=1 Tax=Microtetraspora glauca TaxID=1996 RepID=A0ABV3G8B6_MICGL